MMQFFKGEVVEKTVKGPNLLYCRSNHLSVLSENYCSNNVWQSVYSMLVNNEQRFIV